MTLAWTSAPNASSPYRMQDVRTDDAPLGGAECLTPDGRSLPLAAAKLRVIAGGGLARVVLEQTFENPYTDTLRVTYKMPLPVDGAVSGYAFRVGARTITGQIDRKEKARARFEAAIVQGRTAALLEQEKADIFIQEIGNIPPGKTLVAEITIDQRLAWRPEGEWELRFPTVIGPRYIAASVTPADARASHVELASGGGVRARIHLEVQINDAIAAGRRAESPSHQLSTRPDGAIELLDVAGGRLDRDVVMRWAVAKLDVGLGIDVARPPMGLANTRNAYALLSIVPPAPDAKLASMPRDLIVLLDTSGSMDGGPLEQGKRVVAALIDSLTEQDRLEVIEFSMRPNRYSRTPVPGTRREKEKAIHWVMSRKANGGTEMQSAIVDALQGLRTGAQRQVVLVTDGYVGGEEQIVSLLHESLPPSCRMHVIGVGSGVNRALASSLARAGRGAELLVGLDEDAEKLAKNLVDKTRAPVLTDLIIGGDALVDCAPEHVPDVFAGAPVLAALQVRPTGGEIVVRGNLARGAWEQRIQVPAVDPGAGNGAIVKLYGRERVADLEMRWSIGNEVREIDREIESIGLVFQIATRRTSWVAIDEDRSVDPGLGARHEEIPQELPYGTTMASFGGPTGAAAYSTSTGMVSMEVMAAARPMPMPMSMSAMSVAASSPADIEDPEDDASEVRTMARGRAPEALMSLRSPQWREPAPAADDLMAPRASMSIDQGATRDEEPTTLRPAPMELAAPGARPMGAVASKPQPLGRKRTSTWLVVTLIAGLIALILALAAIVAWLLLTR